MSWYEGLGHILRTDEPLAPKCWLRLGGVAEYFAEPTDRDELVTLVGRCRQAEIPLRLMGGGSNLLIRDGRLPGVTLRLDAPDFCQIAVAECRVRCGGGAALSHTIATAVREGLGGLESLFGIPGTVGGALHGNAGDRANDVGEWVQSVTVLTRAGEVLTRQKHEMAFAYRSSSLDELVILEAEFQLEPEHREELTRRMQKLWIVKRSQQPSSERPAGYLFRDPSGISAGELIEQAGMKGATCGGASLFERDPNVVVTEPGAAADDVLRLIADVRERVAATMGVDLETAIEIW